MKSKSIVILVLILMVSFTFIIYQLFFVSTLTIEQSQAYARQSEAISSLETGMTRQEAESVLANAVGHYQCSYENGSKDIYLFNENLSDSYPLYLIFKTQEGEDILTGIHGSEAYDVKSDVALCNEIR